MTMAGLRPKSLNWQGLWEAETTIASLQACIHSARLGMVGLGIMGSCEPRDGGSWWASGWWELVGLGIMRICGPLDGGSWWAFGWYELVALRFWGACGPLDGESWWAFRWWELVDLGEVRLVDLRMKGACGPWGNGRNWVLGCWELVGLGIMATCGLQDSGSLWTLRYHVPKYVNPPLRMSYFTMTWNAVVQRWSYAKTCI